MKIHLLGRSGSGKSTAAVRLSTQFKLPALDLDSIFWDPGKSYLQQNEPALRDNVLAAFLCQPNWIVEGGYISWVTESFYSADHIIIMDTPLWLCQLRIVKRFIARKRSRHTAKKESLASLWRLLIWNSHYDRTHLAPAIECFENECLPYAACATYEQILATLSNQYTTPIFQIGD